MTKLDEIEARHNKHSLRSGRATISKDDASLLIRAVRQLGAMNALEIATRAYYGGPEVHSAWLGEMLRQKREVVPERTSWLTLHGSDQELDQVIAQAVVRDFLVWFFGHAVDPDVLELIND